MFVLLFRILLFLFVWVVVIFPMRSSPIGGPMLIVFNCPLRSFYIEFPGAYAGGFPVARKPPNVRNEQRFWAFFGRAHDRSEKNAKLQQTVTQSNIQVK